MMKKYLPTSSSSLFQLMFAFLILLQVLDSTISPQAYVFSLSVGVLTLLLATYLVYQAIYFRKVLVPIFLTALIFALYAALVASATSEFNGTRLLVSRYGMIVWLLLGMAVAFSAWVEESAGQAPGRILLGRRVAYVAFFTLPIIVYLDEPDPLMYQDVAFWAGIALISMLYAMFRGKDFNPLYFPVFMLISVCVYIIFKFGSKLFILIWACYLSMFFSIIFAKFMLDKRRYALIIFLILSSFLFGTIVLYYTREYIGVEYIPELSSIISRVSLWSYFVEQFQVAPLTGSFSSEIIAGPGRGYYQHSVLLSTLTHTGIIGGSLLFLLLSMIILKENLLNFSSIYRINVSSMFFTVILVGGVSSFFTWPPLWFLLGLLCVSSIPPIGRQRSFAKGDGDGFAS